MLAYYLVSGNSEQIKDTNGDEPDGIDECSLLCLLGGVILTTGLSLGICAMDYRNDDPRPNANKPGLIVDNVSRCKHPRANPFH